MEGTGPLSERKTSSPILLCLAPHTPYPVSSSGAFSLPSPLHVNLFNSPNPQPCAPQAVEGGDEGVLPCCAPHQPPVALLWTPLCPSSFSLPPFIPPLSPWPYSPISPYSTPPLPCWAGDRPLNAGPGVPDGSYRWSVVIGPIEPCHRIFPAKIQRLGHITSKKKKKDRAREEESKRESASQRMTKATLSFAIKGASVTECFLCSY